MTIRRSLLVALLGGMFVLGMMAGVFIHTDTAGAGQKARPVQCHFDNTHMWCDK